MTSTTEAGETVVLKTDKLGRVKTPATRREHLLDEFARSGLGATQFAELAGIKYQTFATWLQQRRRRARGSTPVPAKAVDSARWLEAVVEGMQAPGSPSQLVLVVQLPGGVRMEVVDEKQAFLAAVLVRALAKSC